jgi:hypothetical protein
MSFFALLAAANQSLSGEAIAIFFNLMQSAPPTWDLATSRTPAFLFAIRRGRQ